MKLGGRGDETKDQGPGVMTANGLREQIRRNIRKNRKKLGELRLVVKSAMHKQEEVFRTQELTMPCGPFEYRAQVREKLDTSPTREGKNDGRAP